MPLPGDDEEPGEDLKRALGEALAPATAWRLHYHMPPTDPRFLDATEHDILHDLATLRYHEQAESYARNPAEYVAHQHQHQQGARDDWGAFEEAIRADKKSQDAIRRIGLGTGAVVPTHFVTGKGGYGNQ